MKKFKETREDLEKFSPTMCFAKWRQVTIHLQHGFTHSCHHPPAHKISIDEVKKNPAALHNSKEKISQREQMLKGEKPSGCEYCWNIESLQSQETSDRVQKSNENWARDNIEEIRKSPLSDLIKPTYLEVSLGSECNFRCSYCAPETSSKIFADYKKHGPFKTKYFYQSLEHLEKINGIPYSREQERNQENPFRLAFWKWLPEVLRELKHLRITGGEPLLIEDTFKLFNYLIENPQPQLSFSLNSNLSRTGRFSEFLVKVEELLNKKLVKNFTLFSSIDSIGAQAEFIRDGLKVEDFWSNAQDYLDCTQKSNGKLSIMITFGILSIPKFIDLLRRIENLRATYKNRVLIDISHISRPAYLSAFIADKKMLKKMYLALCYIKERPYENETGMGFHPIEVAKVERIYAWMISTGVSDLKNLKDMRADFSRFILDYEHRRGLDFLSTFPEMEAFFKKCLKLR